MEDQRLRLSLLLSVSPALAGVSRVFEYGEDKHGEENFNNLRRKPTPIKWSNTLNGSLRHIMQWYCGAVFDHNSGLYHLDHAIGRLLFLSTNEKMELGENDVHGRFADTDLKLIQELLYGKD